jgi:Ca2+-binding RTX toxin-like protein
MMRRTFLLLVTTAVALIAAGGIALAATFTCTTNPCDGTADDDVITGTLSAETINGKAGNDEISARDANDTLNGEDGNDTLHGELGDDWLNGGDGPDHLLGENGTDRLNGGAGNDILDGGPETENDSSTWDYYNFNPNWGNDTIIDGRGLGLLVAEVATAAAMPNLNVDLVSDPTRPEVTDGNGNTMNWANNDVRDATTGAGDDVISQRPKASNFMNGRAGNDTYQGYTTDPSGEDSILDPSGTADVLDLSSYNVPPKDSWRIWKNPSTGNVRTVQLWIGGPPSFCVEEFCRDVFLNNYFDDTSTDVCASKPGPGLIETIKFADDPSVDFAQVRSLLGCPPLDTTITSMTMEPWEASTKTTFGFSSNDDEATFECKLDNGAFEACTSPREYTGLSEGSTHTFEVRAVDPAGNTDTTPASRDWTVDTIAPTVKGVSPVNGATGVAPNTNLEATFSENMNQSTLPGNFALTKQGSSTPIPCWSNLYSSETKTATWNPCSDLEANTTYTATIKSGASGAKDLAGNALAQDYTWSFTTAAPPARCTITGNDTAETISGTSGADVICGLGGNDILKGLGGNDTLRGGGGNDTLQGGGGNDTLDGGTGADTASYSPSLSAVTASLATKTATGEGSDTFLGVENLLGSSKTDTLTGSATNNKLTGGGGNDTERGGSGNDQVIGSGGADFLYGQDGDDTVNSEDGVSGNDTLSGGLGTDTKTTDATEKSIVGFP